MKKKKFVLQYNFYIAEKEAWRAKIVLQEGQVYCNRGSLAAEETVLQYSLVGRRFALQYKLYCELGEGLGCDTAWAGAGRCDTALGVATRPSAQQAQAGAGARRRWGARGAWQTGGRRAGAGRCASAGRRPGAGGRAGGSGERGKRTLGRRADGAGRGRHGAGRCRGARPGRRLCTRCTRPIFDPF